GSASWVRISSGRKARVALFAYHSALATRHSLERRMVELAQEVPDSVATGGFAERADEAVVAEAARDVFQGAQMIPGAVLRRNEHDEQVDRFAVEAIERDAAAADGDGAHQAIDAGMLGVRDGDAAADAGRAQQLAFEDGLDDVFRLAGLEVTG